MRLLILGATGGTGRALTEEGLQRGHDVTAFVRSRQKVTSSDSRLKVVSGDLFSSTGLTATLAGVDAVLSAFGPGTIKYTTDWEDFTRNLVTSMARAGARRLLFLSVGFLFPGPLRFLLRCTVFRNIGKEAAKSERIVEESDLEWSIIRPPRLTNGPQTGRHRATDGGLPRGGMSISRGDLARFMVLEVEMPQHLRKIVGVAR